MDTAISIENGRLSVPDRVTIPFIEGDGVGPEAEEVFKEDGAQGADQAMEEEVEGLGLL